ncbi:enoyl-CoA hydratase/isomerase family protein [Streptomyces sp. NPDC058247]|uniref:enoyl-CoA hydratase/isomerase family protein n=1 Tax=Streptomyces sp. NPDC058247 TaxID=3346401 RepID=UPI0036F19199
MIRAGRPDAALAPLVPNADGSPENALAPVELGDPDILGQVDNAVRGSGRILVGVGRGPLPASAVPLLAVLDCTLLEGTAPPDADPRTADPRTYVPVADADTATERLSQSVRSGPLAALTLAGLLRMTDRLPVAEGLAAEPAAYSTPLAGPEFAAWRTDRPRRPVPPADQPVLVHHDGGLLRLELDRPERHNAFSAALRDGLVEAMEIARPDDTVTVTVTDAELAGRGPSFCSGGDLDEFGTASDPATAHILRLRQSAGAAVGRCRDRERARLHGACTGAGIEVPAFAARVTAHPDAFFQLPELAMGLIPGAGPTVGVTRRIGRRRAASPALTGHRLSAVATRDWRPVDHLADHR